MERFCLVKQIARHTLLCSLSTHPKLETFLQRAACFNATIYMVLMFSAGLNSLIALGLCKVFKTFAVNFAMFISLVENVGSGVC